MKILVTSAGSMSFEAVLNYLNLSNFLIYTTDYNPRKYLPHIKCKSTFKKISSSSNAEKFFLEIVHFCKKERIKFILPLTDPEIDILNSNRKILRSENIILLVSNKISIDISRNKLKVSNTLNKFDVIPTLNLSEFKLNFWRYPLVIKHNLGRSSNFFHQIENEYELIFFKKKYFYLDMIIQPYLRGPVITVDIVRSSKSKQSAAVCREEIIRTPIGAGTTVKIFYDELLIKLAKNICEELNINGCINIEFIKNKGKYFIMDINPRFSAGISFSVAAGYDMIKNHFNCFFSNEIDEQIKYKNKIMSKRLSKPLF